MVTGFLSELGRGNLGGIMGVDAVLSSIPAAGERLVTANGLAAIKVGIDTGVQLVHHVTLVRASRVGGRTGSRADTVSSVGTVGTVGMSVMDTVGSGAVGAVGMSVVDTVRSSAMGAVHARTVSASQSSGLSASGGAISGRAIAHGSGDIARAVTVRVDAGVELVGHVRGVGAGGGVVAVRAGQAASGSAVRAVAAGQTAPGAAVRAVSGSAGGVAGVRVDTRVQLVGHAAIVGSSTGRRAVSSISARGAHTSSMGAMGAMGASAMSAGVTGAVTATGSGQTGGVATNARSVRASSGSSGAGTVQVGIDAGVELVSHVRRVRTGGGVVSMGAGQTAARVVGGSRGVGACGASSVGAVTGDSLLDLIDDIRHDL